MKTQFSICNDMFRMHVLIEPFSSTLQQTVFVNSQHTRLFFFFLMKDHRIKDKQAEPCIILFSITFLELNIYYVCCVRNLTTQ